MERRLTAILSADVVGYSALMERDEARALERLKTVRTDMFEPRIAASPRARRASARRAP